MKLVNARLCLDCEEVHEEQHCPICGSESFAFMTRWVAPSDTVGADVGPRPARAPEVAPAASGPRRDGVERREQLARREQVDAYRQILNPGAPPPRRGRLVARGAIGLALLGLARAVWRAAPDAKGSTASERKTGPRKELR